MSRLRDMRIRYAITQEDIARRLGVRQPTYYMWEADRTAMSQRVLLQCADLYLVSCDYLLGRDSREYVTNVDNPIDYTRSRRDFESWVVKLYRDNMRRQGKMERITRYRELRRKRRMTQKQFAERIGLTQANYGRYETGTRQPDADMLIRIADEFGVSIDYLIGRCDTPYYVRKDDDLVPAKELENRSPRVVRSDPIPWLPSDKDEFEKYIIRIINEATK